MQAIASAEAMTSETCKCKFMQSKGLNILSFPLQPDMCPHFNVVTMAPMDVMHGETDGLLQYEGYCMLYSLIRLQKWADVDRVNALIASYNWPAGQRPPDIHASVTKGAVGNVPYP
eukprot:1161333-Pleurochrysis_carterae.AAC.1